VLAVGCHAAPSDSAITPHDPCLSDSWRPALEVPAHADPSFDPDTGLWAHVARFGPLYLTAEGPPFPADDVQAIVHDVFFPYFPTVLDAGSGPEDRRRVFLLCDEDEGQRIGFWQAATDLRRTNRSRTVLVGQPRVPEAIDETTPGVRLPPGAVDAELPEDAASARAVYEGDEVRAEGWISAAAVDIVIEREAPSERARLVVDGILVAAEGAEVAVYDAPGGAAFAWISTSVFPTSSTRVRKLDERAGFVLVDVFDVTEVGVVGWIEVEAFEARPPELASPWRGKGGGGGWTSSNMSRLERGTLLIHEASELVVGVVTETREFRCVGPCEEPAPRIEISACEHDFRVRALRPSTSSLLCPN
jgi:hypothetical protein